MLNAILAIASGAIVQLTIFAFTYGRATQRILMLERWDTDIETRLRLIEKEHASFHGIQITEAKSHESV